MNRVPRLIHPGVDPSCPHCAGRGYQIVRLGERAGAELCSCAADKICPVCRDTGWVRPTGKPHGAVTRCRCRRFVQRLERFATAGVPGRLADCGFENFKLGKKSEGQHEAYGTAMALAAHFKPGEVNRGFVLWGEVGRGKTHMLVATLRALALEHGVRTRFIEFSHLLSELKGRFDRGEGAAALLNELVEVEVLAIDEVGKGMLTEFELAVVDELVSRRYNAARTILATSNYRPGKATGIQRPNLADNRPGRQPTLSDRVGERVYSRMREMCEFVELGGEDWREKHPRHRW